MREQVRNYILNHEAEIESDQFDWLFAAAPSAGVEKHELMLVLMEAGIEPLRFMESIPNRSFYQYPHELTIPSNIESIQMCAFEEAKFTELVIPENVNHIGSAAFKNCLNLRRLTFPKSLIKIQSWILFHCYDFEEIIYEGTKDEFLSISEMRVSCFIPETSIDSYDFKITCTDGIIGLKDLLHYAK